MAFNWADITNPQGPTRTPWNWAAVSAPQTSAPRTDQFVNAVRGTTQPRTVAPAVPAPSMGGQRIVADRFGGPAAPMGPSAEDQASQFIQDMLMLAYGGGGGGPDLSGYQGLIDDVNARRDALNVRKWQQRQFLTDLFDAAESRISADKAGIADTVAKQLQNDALRRAQDVSLVRDEEAARRIVADAARGALGVTPGEDLSSAVSQNAAGGIVASGTVADRDARIQQSIAEQQLGRELAGLTPMEAMYVGDLMTQYEDRLAALASERAGIKAQMAQARASSGGRGGPSISELLALQEAANEQFGLGGAGAVELPDILQTGRGIQQEFGPVGRDIIAIGDRILSSSQVSGLDPTKPAGAQELLTKIAASDPAVRSLLQTYPMAAGAIVNYVVQASK